MIESKSINFYELFSPVPFQLEIEEMNAIFDLQERFIPKLVKPRFIVPEKAPEFLKDIPLSESSPQVIEEVTSIDTRISDQDTMSQNTTSKTE